MMACPKGAIITHDELYAFESALAEAASSMVCLIRSECRPNRADHDDDYRMVMADRRKLLKLFERTLKTVQRVRMARRG